MHDRNSGDHQCDQPILGFLSPKAVKTINLLAGITAVLGVVVGFVTIYLQFQDQEQQQILQINAAVGNLAAQEKPDITSPFIHNNLKWMHRKNFSMTGIVLRGMKFYMAEFEEVAWQGVEMKRVEFACSVQAQ